MTKEPTDLNPITRARSAPRWQASLLVVLLLLALSGLIFGELYLTKAETWVVDNALEFGAWVARHTFIYVLVFMAAYIAVSFFGLPFAALLSVSGGAACSLAFGFWPGTLISAALVWVSVVLGSWALFEFVRRYGAAAFETWVGPYVARFRHGFGQDQFLYMLAGRFTPLPPAVMSIVPTLLGARRGPFLAAALLGFLPGVLVYAALGAKLGQLLAKSRDDLSFATVLTFDNTWPLLALFALSLVPLILRYRQRRRAESP